MSRLSCYALTQNQEKSIVLLYMQYVFAVGMFF